MLKFQCKLSSRSKCSKLSEERRLIKMLKLSENGGIKKNVDIFKTKLEINQNVDNWVLIIKSTKPLTFECKSGIDQNVEICD